MGAANLVFEYKGNVPCSPEGLRNNMEESVKI